MKNKMYAISILMVVCCLLLFACPFPDHPPHGEKPDPDAGILEFSHAGGVYWGVFDLDITDPEGRPIYYTLDGSDPSISLTRSLYNSPVTITGNVMVTAAAMNTDETYTEIQAETYQIDDNAGQPGVSPLSDRFAQDQLIELTEDTNTEVYYTFTTDGTEPSVPTRADTLCTGSFSVTASPGQSVTYRYAFKAFTTALNPTRSAVESDVLYHTWIIDKEPPAPPSGLQARLSGDRRMHVSWTDSVSADLSHYEVYYGPGAAPEDAQTLFGNVLTTAVDIQALSADQR
jgi:hypothetical protein